MVDILLLNPPKTILKEEEVINSFPLGLAYIAGVLEIENLEFEVLDCFGEKIKKISNFNKYNKIIGLNINEIRKKIIQTNPRIILITCSTINQESIVIKINQMIKEIIPKTIIISGGPHVSCDPKNFLKNDKNTDYVYKGECEDNISLIMNNLLKKNSIKNIEGICYRKENDIIINSKKKYPELDELPYPARHLFPFENYIKQPIKQTLFFSKNRIAEIITSRGCPYNCKYCGSNLINGLRWRKRTINNVICEIKFLQEKYYINEIHFIDDNISNDKNRFVELCNELIKLKIRWTIPNGITISSLDEKLLRLMYKSGCYAIFFPIETANEHIQKKYLGKKVDLFKTRKIIKYAKKIGIYTIGLMILGFYEESKKDIKNSINYICNTRLDEVHFNILTPISGTKIYPYKNKKNQFSTKKANLNTKYLKIKEIERLRDLGYIKFEFTRFIKNPLMYFHKFDRDRLKRYIKTIINRF